MEGRELTVLPAIFQQMAAFNYNKARDLAEKERCNSEGCHAPLWPSFLSCLGQLAAVERLYMSLNLLTIKGFLRRENSVRASYESLLTELSDLEGRAGSFSSGEGGGVNATAVGGVNALIWSLSTELLSFIRARICLIKFYESCQSISVSGGGLEYSDLANSIAGITATYTDSFTQPLLAALHANLRHECCVLSAVLQAMHSIQQHDFLSALLHLDAAYDALLLWQKTITCRENKKYSFSSSFLKGGTSVPLLYQWLWQVRAAANAKFSLYFFHSLAHQSSLQEMKTLLAKQPIDYVTKIVQFHRRCEASDVTVVLDTAAMPGGYRGPGYSLPHSSLHGASAHSDLHHAFLSSRKLSTASSSSPAEGGRGPPPPPPPPPPQGAGRSAVSAASRFERIFAFPLLSNTASDSDSSSVCWDSLRLFLTKPTSQHPPPRDNVVQIYTHQSGYTHYLRQVEPLVTVAVSYDCHRTEKESAPVRDFLNDLSQHLTLAKVFASLKPK